MKKNYSLILLIFIFVKVAIAQDSSMIELKFSGLFQFIIEESKNATNFKIGNTEIGTRVQYNNSLGLRVIYSYFSDKSINLLDGFAYYKPTSYFEVRAGQFKIPFSLEALLPPHKKDFIVDSKTSKIIQTRDIGGGLYYNNRFLETGIALINGSNINKNDNNNFKDFVGRISFKPLENALIGSSIYLGKSRVDSIDLGKKDYDFHIKYKIPFELVFQSEFVIQKFKAQNSNTGYITIGYFLNNIFVIADPIELLLRFENTSIESQDVTKYLTAGINYYFDKFYYIRMQLNYTRSWSNSFNDDLVLFSINFYYDNFN